MNWFIILHILHILLGPPQPPPGPPPNAPCVMRGPPGMACDYYPRPPAVPRRPR